MSDVLSGGVIDDSTDGPIPPKVDDRSRDILGEQKAKEQQDAVGGTQYAPRVEPPPPIPVAPEVAPPLPVVPSFDFNVSGSILEEIREISRQAMVDAFKNVTINGQSPAIEGSTIAFTVQPTQPSASESFMFQNGDVGQVAPPTVNAPPPQPREEIQSVVVSPPSRPREEQRPERRGVDSEDFGTMGRGGFLEPALTPLSGETKQDRSQEIRDEARGRGVGIDFNDAQIARNEARERGVGIDFNDAQEARDEARREDPSGEAYAAAESRSGERKESDPDFDRESDIRQKGETLSEFKERQKEIATEKKEAKIKEIESPDVLDNESVLTRDISGPIAVSLIRADGEDKVFAMFRSEVSKFGEPTLPKSEYWVGGVPDGTNQGDILYWDTSGIFPTWKVLEAPENATIAIEEFNVCVNGEPKTKNMLVWNTPE
jgi:hypothetical protein